MQKRVISFLLSAAILLGLFCGAAPVVHAASMKASDACIAMIKEMEGFSKYPYEDNGQYTVGYGTACPEEDLERYKADGITEEEADALLRDYIADFESSLNSFANKNGLSLSQCQFDALFSFTYNVGGSWMNSESTFRTAVLSGATGNDFIFAIARWCTASGKVMKTLIERRLIEANMYLNGVYKNSVPSNYKYVIFDDNLDGAENDVRVQAFDTNTPDKIRSTPTADGYTFQGWFTQASGGTQVTVLDANVSVTTLYAHWINGEGNAPVTEPVIATGTVNTEKLNVRSGPGMDYSVVGYLYAGDAVEIYELTTVDGTSWGRVSNGWICMDYILLNEEEEPPKEETPAPETVIARVVITAEKLNVRSGAGTEYEVVGYLYAGDEVELYEKTTVDGVQWGRCSEGWINLSYAEEKVIARGVITADTLNVRSGPGSSYSIVGYVYKGDEVEIYETAKDGDTTWARISDGWISMGYVELVTEEEPEPEPEKEPVIAEGVVTADKLKIRSGAGTSNSIVGYLYEGDEVEIYEITTVNGTPWGRISDGWISLDYVKLHVEAPEISASNVTSTGKIRITWDAVDGAAKYKVYRSTKKDGTYKLLKTMTGTKLTNTSAVAGTTYYYYVVSVDQYGNESEASNIVKRTCDCARPEISVTNVASSGKIRITWDAVDGAKQYKVYRATSKNGEYKLLKTMTGTKLTNTSAVAGTTYYYKVIAIAENSNGNSAYSEVKSRTCDLPRPVVSITSNKDGKPRLIWDAVDGAVGYEIYRAESKNGTYSLLKTVTGTRLTNTSAKTGVTYYYKVVALAEKSAANSAKSAIVSITSE